MNGTLYVVATPIGNLSDITPRAVEVLKTVDLIAAEDTRHTRKLLSSLEIHARLVSFHEYSEPGRVRELVEALCSGKNIALVSDAGTPVISDPGEALAIAAAEAGVELVAVPGPCAAAAALSVCALPVKRFFFEGFLPRDASREAALLELCRRAVASVLYESPHHLSRTLLELASRIPERRIALCRELTKLHEEVLRMSVREACEYYAAQEPRGEFVLVLEGAGEQPAEEASDEQILEALQALLEAGETRKSAAAQVAAALNVSKNRVYALSLKL